MPAQPGAGLAEARPAAPQEGLPGPESPPVTRPSDPSALRSDNEGPSLPSEVDG